MSNFVCKTSFTASEEEILTRAGFKKTQWPNMPTIWYKVYKEDVDENGAVLELILNPYGEAPGSVGVNVNLEGVEDMEDKYVTDFSFSNCTGALYQDLLFLCTTKLAWTED